MLGAAPLTHADQLRALNASMMEQIEEAKYWANRPHFIRGIPTDAATAQEFAEWEASQPLPKWKQL